jgi:hypothetical protein
MQRRILIYSGRADREAAARAAAVARAVLHHDPGAACLLAGRGLTPLADAPDGLTVVELPALVANGGQAGGPQAARAGLRLLADLALSFLPHVVVVDRDPLGMLGELATALAALSAMAHPPRTWLALDDLDLIRLASQPGGLRALERTAGRYGALLVFAEADGCEPFVATALLAGRVRSVGYAGWGRWAPALAPDWTGHHTAGRQVVVAPEHLGPRQAPSRLGLQGAVSRADLVVTAPDHPALDLALAHGRSLLVLVGTAERPAAGPEHVLRARALERRGRARVLERAWLGTTELMRMAAVAAAIPLPPEGPPTAERAARLLLDAA